MERFNCYILGLIRPVPFRKLTFTSAKEVMFLPDFVFSVSVCVFKITQKVMDRSF